MPRTTIKVTGVQERRSGISDKTKKPYDFQSVSFVYDEPHTAGQAAATALINGPDIDAIGGQIVIGQEYDVVYHTYGGKVLVDCLIC